MSPIIAFVLAIAGFCWAVATTAISARVGWSFFICFCLFAGPCLAVASILLAVWSVP